MKGFIAKHLNLIPTGVGNNSTGYNVLILQKGAISESASEDKDGDGSLCLKDELEGQMELTLLDEGLNFPS